jgi:hypothetical protein
MLRKRMQHLLGTLGLAVLLSAPIAAAQESPPVRVRGTIERVDGLNLVVRSRAGTELKVVLADNALVVAIAKASLADVKPGAFVGVTGMPQPDGTQRALEVHVFPEAMRGTGEGHRPWDLQPQSTMTNGNVDQTVVGIEGQTLTLSYKGGEKKIVVPSDAPIVSIVPGDRTDLKPGTKIFIVAAKSRPTARCWHHA